MASADHIRALLRSHAEGDDDRFYSVAMQLAAHEARSGHGKFAKELRDIIDTAKSLRHPGQPGLVGSGHNEIFESIQTFRPKSRLADLILNEMLAAQLGRVLQEHRNAGRILEHGLYLRRKLAFIGPPGSGKSMAASVMAGELGLPLFQIRLDVLITQRREEIEGKLRQVSDATSSTRGVYLFDNFDAIFSRRESNVEIIESRQVLSGFLVMFENDQSGSILIVAARRASNFRRRFLRLFDDVLDFTLPTELQIAHFLRMRLGRVAAPGICWDELGDSAIGLSYQELSGATNEVLKSAIISGLGETSESVIRNVLTEKKRITGRLSSNST